MWASMLSALFLLHVVWARYWPQVFQRDHVAHAEPVAEGYRVGRAILWRLPRRAAPVPLALAALPWLGRTWLGSTSLMVLLAVLTPVSAALWLTLPPGMRGTLDAPPTNHGAPGAVRFERDLGRALATFAMAGLVPALAVSATLSRLLRL
jgi:hypothetical protein